jgi:hypothetical protein
MASMPGFFLLLSSGADDPGVREGRRCCWPGVGFPANLISASLGWPFLEKECHMARKLFLLQLVPLLLGLMAGPALAQATSTTTPFHGATDEFVDVNPCTGDPATIQLTFNGVLHESTAADGSMHVTGTQTGTIVVTPLDPTLPSYTGRFTVWFGGNLNSQSEGSWFTLSVKATGSDGSQLVFNLVEQLHISATGEVTVEFLKVNCR